MIILELIQKASFPWDMFMTCIKEIILAYIYRNAYSMLMLYVGVNLPRYVLQTT